MFTAWWHRWCTKMACLLNCKTSYLDGEYRRGSSSFPSLCNTKIMAESITVGCKWTPSKTSFFYSAHKSFRLAPGEQERSLCISVCIQRLQLLESRAASFVFPFPCNRLSIVAAKHQQETFSPLQSPRSRIREKRRQRNAISIAVNSIRSTQ